MTKCSLTSGQSRGNRKKIYVENKTKTSQTSQTPQEDQRQSQNKAGKNPPNKSNDEDINALYLSFSNAQKIIHQLLSYPREVLLPARVPKFTAFKQAVVYG